MELFNEVLKKQTPPWKDFFRMVYGEGVTDAATFQVHDFSSYSEDARKEFILSLSREDDDVLNDFLRNVYMAVMVEMPFSCDNLLVEKPREMLLQELLCWAEWGVDPAYFPIYQVAFALVYYAGADIFGYKFETYHAYDEELRAAVISGLCANECTNVLEIYILNARESKSTHCHWYTQKWKNVGVSRHLSLLFELSNWYDWGADLPLIKKELSAILFEYIDKQDCNGFVSALSIVRPCLEQETMISLRHAVYSKKFKENSSGEQFLAALDNYAI